MLQDTLKERRNTHGPFSENARVSQALKTMMRNSTAWPEMTELQHEALDMIALKLSRIITGDPTHIDAWHDLAGYATLAENELVENQEDEE